MVPSLSLVAVVAILASSPTTARAESDLMAPDALYQCELNYLPVQSSFIKFSINYLSFVDDPEDWPREPEDEPRVVDSWNLSDVELGGGFTLVEIDYNSTLANLSRYKLNLSLPFVFFINGFNTFNPQGDVNRTWMFDVARNFARRRAQAGATQATKLNVIFLTWGIPKIFADNVLAMIPSYYKTVASYKKIRNFVGRTFEKLVGFIEAQREWSSEEERLRYFSKFEFYGHSLGAHIMTDGLLQIHSKFPQLRFGKLIGLDPATPCFLNDQYGISAAKAANVTDKVVVVHSNAGLAGLTSERTDVEIVLNGGTFQPACAWYDFACDHSRSTDVLRYLDDRCQMVAYKCSSYKHFKMGACETCESLPGEPLPSSNSSSLGQLMGPNCVLVNLKAQHHDSKELLALTGELDDNNNNRGPVRQLAEEETDHDGTDGIAAGSRDLAPREHPESELLSRATHQKAYYHFVNTNPKFKVKPRTHCLEHYQLRLLAMADEQSQLESCPPSSFHRNADQQIHLRLFYERHASNRLRNNNDRLTGLHSPDFRPQNREYITETTLEAVVRDRLFTGLVNFVGRPRLFVGAQVQANSLDLGRLATCLSSATGNASSIRFVLDVAFMSHTEQRIRHAFSSVLCGSWPLPTGVAEGVRDEFDDHDHDHDHDHEGLVMELCKQSELAQVGDQLDQLVAKVREEQLPESWKVNLLNNIFSLFTNWSPFRRQQVSVA